MTRFEMRHQQPKTFKLYKWIIMCTLLFVCIGMMVGFSKYAQSTIKIDAPEVDHGRKVVVHLPNGKDVFTYEKLLVKEGQKLYYKGERNTLDLTGGQIEYQEWSNNK